MTRRLVLAGVACVAGRANSCGRTPVPPAPDGLAVGAPAPPPGPAPEPPAPLPRHLLARFGDTRLRAPGPVRSVALSADGAVLAAATRDEPVVRFWDAATGRLLRAFTVKLDNTTSLTVVGFAPDGRLLAVRHQPRQDGVSFPMHEPVVLDPRTGSVVRWGWGNEAEHYLPSLTVSPDGRTVAGVTINGEVKVWEFDTGRELRTLGQTKSPYTRSFGGVNFSPDGARVAVWCDDASVSVGPLDGTGPLVRFPTEAGRRVCFAAWPRADRLVVVWPDGLAAVDPATGRELARAARPGNMLANPRTAAGQLLFARPGHDGDTLALDLMTLAPIPDRVYRGSARDEPVAVSADGSRVALATGHAVRLFDAATAAALHPDLDRQPSIPATGLHLSADGRRLLAVGAGAGVWDVPAGRLLSAFRRPGRWPDHPDPVGLTPDGRRVLGGSVPGGRAAVLDAETGAERFRVPDPVGGQPVNRQVFGEDPAGAVWVLETGTVCRVEVPSGKVVRQFAAPPGTTEAVLSPDGRRVAVGGWRTLAVRGTDPAGEWHVLAHVPARRDCGLSPPHGPFPRAFGPDGRRLLADDDRMSLAVWDLPGKAPVNLGRLATRDGWWRFGPRPAFSPDGRRIAVAGEALDDRGEAGPSSVRVWETASLAEVARLIPPTGATGCVFTPDGRRLLVAHADTTFGVWDYAAIEAEAVGPPPADGLWERLGDPDARAGVAAVHALAADPPGAVALLRERFRPADPAAVAALAADLGSPDFATRERAERELTRLGGAAAGLLREAVRGSPVPEVVARAERILRRDRATDLVRPARAVEVLERVGTADARAVLADWANQSPGAALGADARAALGRLGRAGAP